MKKVFCMFCLSAVLSLSSAYGAEFGLRAYYWFPTLSGHIRVDEDVILGTKLDLVDDLGIDNESFTVGEIFAGFGGHHIAFAFSQAEYKGRNVLDRDINFNGVTYQGTDTITSNLRYTTYDLMYQYDLMNLENVLAGFSLGLVGRVKVLDGSVRLQSATTGLEESKDFIAPIPMLGLNLHVGLIADLLEARALGTGIGYADAKVFDGQAEVSLTPLPFLGIHGGYRIFFIDVNRDDVDFNYDTSGPYLGVTVKF